MTQHSSKSRYTTDDEANTLSISIYYVFYIKPQQSLDRRKRPQWPTGPGSKMWIEDTMHFEPKKYMCSSTMTGVLALIIKQS